jgi:hypothetical protein
VLTLYIKLSLGFGAPSLVLQLGHRAFRTGDSSGSYKILLGFAGTFTDASGEQGHRDNEAGAALGPCHPSPPLASSEASLML